MHLEVEVEGSGADFALLPGVVDLPILLDVLLNPLHGDVHAPILAPEVDLIPTPGLPPMVHGLVRSY